RIARAGVLPVEPDQAPVGRRRDVVGVAVAVHEAGTEQLRPPTQLIRAAEQAAEPMITVSPEAAYGPVGGHDAWLRRGEVRWDGGSVDLRQVVGEGQPAATAPPRCRFGRRMSGHQDGDRLVVGTMIENSRGLDTDPIGKFQIEPELSLRDRPGTIVRT